MASTEIASESGHWYLPDGTPFYSIIGKNGNERATTLRDARPVKAAPGVTSVTKCAAKPMLDTWIQKQVMLAALTLPRITGESEEQFCDRILLDSKAQGKAAAERGTALHGAIELYLQGKVYDLAWEPHVNAVKTAMREIGVDLHGGEAERSFYSPLGYGGKVDWHKREPAIVVDWKSKQRIEDGKDYAFDEHAMQLAACGMGLGLTSQPFFLGRHINVFIGVEDARVSIKEWAPEEIERGWSMFKALLTYWQHSKNYYPTETAV